MPEPTVAEPPPAEEISKSDFKPASLEEYLNRLNLTPIETPKAAETPVAPPTEPAPPSPATPPPEIFTPPEPPNIPATEPEQMPDMPDLPKESFKSEQQHADWGKFRKAYNVAKEKLEAKVQAPVVDQGAQAEIEQLKQRLSEMSAVVERADLLSHPAIEQQINVPRRNLLGQAERLLQDVGLEPDIFERALALTGKSKIEALDEMNEAITSPTVRMEIADLAINVQRLDRQKEQMLSDVKANRQRIDLEEQSRRHQAMQQQEKQLVNLVDMAYAQLRDQAGFEFLQEVDGNEQWNNGRKEVRQAATALLTQNTDPRQLAAAAVLAPLAAQYRAAYQTERTARLAAEKALKERDAAEPGLGGPGGNGAAATADGAINAANPIPDLIRKFLH